MIDKKRIEKAVSEILAAIGENPEREGLKDTPRRVAEMYGEIFSGLSADPAKEITIFKEEYYDSFVAVTDIPLYSVCEHHLLPFFGVARVVYAPTEGKILGLSKIARIVDILSKKPQLQERLSNEIAETMERLADAKGVFVEIEAEHLCMSMRGIRKPGAKTVTVAARGIFGSDETLRREAYRLLGK